MWLRLPSSQAHGTKRSCPGLGIGGCQVRRRVPEALRFAQPPGTLSWHWSWTSVERLGHRQVAHVMACPE
eukprot:9137930-Alexandrium_andersonii.AAC.1